MKKYILLFLIIAVAFAAAATLAIDTYAKYVVAQTIEENSDEREHRILGGENGL